MATFKYKVQQSDKPETIAQKFNLTTDQLLKANPGGYPFSTGQGIKIPQLYGGRWGVPPQGIQPVPVVPTTPQLRPYQAPKIQPVPLQTVPQPQPYTSEGGMNRLVPQTNLGSFSANENVMGSQVTSGADYRGSGGLAPDQALSLSDKTGILDPTTIAYVSKMTGVPAATSIANMIKNGWQFDPISGKYVNSQIQTAQNLQSDQNSEWYREYGVTQNKPGSRGNRSGHNFRNAHGSLVRWNNRAQRFTTNQRRQPGQRAAATQSTPQRTDVIDFNASTG